MEIPRDQPQPQTRAAGVIGYRRLTCGHHVPADWPPPPYCAYCVDSQEAHLLHEQLVLHDDFIEAAYGEYVAAPDWA